MSLLRRKHEPEEEPWERDPVHVTRDHLRWMRPTDLPAVLQIERLCFEWPWSEADFRGALRRRNCIAMVMDAEISTAPKGGPVLAYCLYSLDPNSIEILNLAVHPEWQRGGIGTIILNRLKQKLDTIRRHTLRVCVNEHLLAAQLFFRSQEFEYRCTATGYHRDGSDGYWFTWKLKGGV